MEHVNSVFLVPTLFPVHKFPGTHFGLETVQNHVVTFLLRNE